MSKIGKKPIIIPQDVSVKIENKTLAAQGKEGSLTVPILPYTDLELKDGQLTVTLAGSGKQAEANLGTMRALAQNAITGVRVGFSKELEIQGIGFRAVLEGNTLVLYMGFTHTVKFPVPEKIKIAVEKNFIRISGVDKYLVGETAAKIRAVKKPEPYQGKGIRYKGEIVRRKEGKKAASATTAGAK